MKVAVVGLGAVGGLIAMRLAAAGHAVSAFARGATLAAVRADGLRLIEKGVESSRRIAASDDPRELGPQDLVVVALKGPALAGAVAGVDALLGPESVVMPAMNGVPWWFLESAPVEVELADRRLRSVDPDGSIAAALPLERILGCVVHLTCSTPAPGVVRLGFGDRLIVGEPRGGLSRRAERIAQALQEAGFQAAASADVRHEVWYKLWGNMTMNPVSALTGAESDRLLDDPLVLDFMLAAMEEARAIGQRIGCPIGESGEARMAIARQLGAFKTSMLQDTLAGRPLEIDALVGAVHEIGARLGIAMPAIGALLGLARTMARQRGLYPAPVPAPSPALAA